MFFVRTTQSGFSILLLSKFSFIIINNFDKIKRQLAQRYKNYWEINKRLNIYVGNVY